MEERFRFVLRLLEGEDMSSVCREFGISRKTGYKIFERYKDHGLESLSDRCRRPVRYGNQLPEQVEAAIVRFKREKPHCGARKIREMLVRQIPNDVRIPAVSTVQPVMDRHGLVRLGTVARVHRRVKALFKFHEREENIGNNPMAKVKPPKLDREILPAFTREEVLRML